LILCVNGIISLNNIKQLNVIYMMIGFVKFKMFKIPPVVLYGCETWSVTLRAKHRLRVFENRVLRRIFGPKRDEVTGEWRKVHSEELLNLYSSPVIIREVMSRRMRWAGHVTHMGEAGKVHKVLVGKPEGRGHLEDQGVGGKIRSEWIFGRLAWWVWIGFHWLRTGTGGGLL
jgi:hypothetical protein